MLFAAAAAASIWAAVCLWTSHAGWSPLGAILLLSLYPFVLAVELMLATIVNARTGDRSLADELRFRTLFRAWLDEVNAGFILFGWRQPFRSHAEPDQLYASADGCRGVVLVHGLVCNRGFWNPWMKLLRARGGVAFIAVDLEPMFGSIDDYLGTLEAAIVKITAATGVAPVVVAHSMGGLAVRRWLDSREADAQVHRVITIGTPHCGTWLARYAGTLNGREMAIGSSWLGRLQLNEGAHPNRAALFTCFYGNCDNVVFPAVNARLAGADNRLLRATAHVRLAFHPDVMAEVIRCSQSDAHMAAS